jgi:hypothetical protein
MENTAPESLQDKFMKAFKFDEIDLSSNKEGSLSVNQKKRILNQGILSFSSFGFVGILFAGLFLFSARKPINGTTLQISAGMFVVFAVIGIALSWLYWRAYKLGTVKQINGKVFFQQVSGQLRLCIGKTCIPTLMNVTELFEDEAIYNIYYAPLISVIVAVEKVS